MRACMPVAERPIPPGQALVLIHYLAKLRGQPGGGVPLAGARVLELGAGTGAVGLAAALLGAGRVLLTDRPQLMGLLRQNIEVCFPGRADGMCGVPFACRGALLKPRRGLRAAALASPRVCIQQRGPTASGVPAPARPNRRPGQRAHRSRGGGDLRVGEPPAGRAWV